MAPAKLSTPVTKQQVKLVLLGEGNSSAAHFKCSFVRKAQASITLSRARLASDALPDTGHVGKSSLLARYINNVFREDRQATVQAAFMSKQLTVDGQQARSPPC